MTRRYSNISLQLPGEFSPSVAEQKTSPFCTLLPMANVSFPFSLQAYSPLPPWLYSFFFLSTFLKCLLNSLQCYFCLTFCIFCLWELWDVSSQTKDGTCTPCLGQWSLNHWTTKGSPLTVFFVFVFAYLHQGECLLTGLFRDLTSIHITPGS